MPCLSVYLHGFKRKNSWKRESGVKGCEVVRSLCQNERETHTESYQTKHMLGRAEDTVGTGNRKLNVWRVTTDVRNVLSQTNLNVFHWRILEEYTNLCCLPMWTECVDTRVYFYITCFTSGWGYSVDGAYGSSHVLKKPENKTHDTDSSWTKD